MTYQKVILKLKFHHNFQIVYLKSTDGTKVCELKRFILTEALQEIDFKLSWYFNLDDVIVCVVV